MRSIRLVRTLRYLALLGLLASVPAVTPALAQINPFGDSSKTKLSPGDFKMVDEATQRLLARPSLAPGAKESWTNPATKSTGTLTVKNRFQRRGFSCVAVGYQSMARGRPPNRAGALNWCKTPKGWKIL